MDLLLTSGGLTNPSIRDALSELLGKPLGEATALCIPTAEWAHPWCTPFSVARFLTGQHDVGWKSLGVLELTALPTVRPERWTSWVREADVLMADGGDAMYLAHWLRRSGLAELLPSLTGQVWVGVSAGSMVMTPRIGADFVTSGWPDEGDRPLGLVDFSIFPHLDHPDMPTNTRPAAERWAAEIGHRAYALDDQSAIRVTGAGTDVISEGSWLEFPAAG